MIAQVEGLITEAEQRLERAQRAQEAAETKVGNFCKPLMQELHATTWMVYWPCLHPFTAQWLSCNILLLC